MHEKSISGTNRWGFKVIYKLKKLHLVIESARSSGGFTSPLSTEFLIEDVIQNMFVFLKISVKILFKMTLLYKTLSHKKKNEVTARS